MSEEACALTERLQKLEKQVRRIRITAACAVIVGGSFCLLGQAAPSTGVVEAKDFMLRDNDGRLRGRLFMDGQLGGPALMLYDEHVSPRVQQLRPLPGAAVDRDRYAAPRLTLGLVNNRPYLRFSDPTGRQSANLTLRENGPEILLYDENEKAGVELVFIKGRGPPVTLMDADQNIRARLEIDKSEPFLKVTGGRSSSRLEARA